jgi:peptidoglycan/LPS O-acetylase OafA/YrhL
MTRHYGMDWLRIGAFALLIFYHIGMVFVPWNFHVKSSHIVDWATLPMLATNAWRLTLLFVVSGYASRALLRRSSGVGGFLGNRSYRLLLPLLFGVAVIVPPQAWVELVTKHGYAGSYTTFWTHDWFRFARIDGVALPTWNHLWFVGYLWIYTMLLGLAVLVVPRIPVQRWFDRGFGGFGVLALPLAWLIAVHSWWFPMAAETQALVGDWIAHVTFLPAFLFGFALARSEPAMAAIARWWRAAAILAVLGYAFIIGVERWWPDAGGAPRWIYPFYGAAHAVQQWAAVIALIGIAECFFNRDRPIRPLLTEAVFPFYLVHQTIIVVVMWAILPAALPAWAEFAILVGATIAGCWFFYLIGRAIPPLRPLIGLRGGRSSALPRRTSPGVA